MAEEAILKIVIVDEAARQGNPVPPAPGISPTGGGPQVSPLQPVPAIKSFEQFNTNFAGMTAEFTKAVQSFQQSAKQLTSVAKPEKQILAIEYKQPVTNATPFERLQALSAKKGTIDPNELDKILSDARLTKTERDFVEHVLMGQRQYKDVAEYRGVTKGAVSQTAKSIENKMQFPMPISEFLQDDAADAKRRAVNEQRSAQRITREKINSGALMLDAMSEQDPGDVGPKQKVATWEKVINKLAAASIYESEKASPDEELLAEIGKAAQAVYSTHQGDRERGAIPKEVLNAARKAKSTAKLLKILGPHLAAGDLFDSEFGDDPDVPGAWMDESDFDLPPMARILDDGSTSLSDISPYSHYAEGGSVGARAMREYGIKPVKPTWTTIRVGSGPYQGDFLDSWHESTGTYYISASAEDANGKVVEWGIKDKNNSPWAAPWIASSKSLEAVMAIAEELVRDQAMQYALEFAKEHNDYDHMAKGGRINMTRGGTVPNMGHAQSGADWHPAWLTDNEFVMNAKSAARNRNALYAANADPNVTLVARHYATGGQAAGAALQVSRAAGVAVDPIIGAAVAVGVVLEQIRNDFIDGLKKATAGVLQFADALSAKSGEYSPTVASAEALVEIRQTMGDFRRAQEAGPELARYLRAQGGLQQKAEDLKIKLLLKILPSITTVVTILEKIMPAGEGIVAVIEALSGPLGLAVAAINRIANAAEDANRPEVPDPTDLILNGGMSFPPPE